MKEKKEGLLSAFIAFCSLFAVMELAWIYMEDYGVIFSTESQWDKVTLLQAIQNPSWIMNLDFLSFFAISLPMVIISIVTIFPFFLRKMQKILQDKLFPYYFQAAFLILFFLAVGGLRPLARFFSTILPIYWVLAIWGRKKRYFKTLILLLFIIQLALGTILFANWYPFT